MDFQSDAGQLESGTQQAEVDRHNRAARIKWQPPLTLYGRMNPAYVVWRGSSC
jgi:hypothetical protein